MKTIPLHEAQPTLADLVHRLLPGERVTITENDRPVADLVVPHGDPMHPIRPRPAITGIPKAGRWRGQIVVPDDFDQPLEEMREYME